MTTSSNDNQQLTPQTGSYTRALDINLSGFSVGIAEYPEGPTGCTVFRFDQGAVTTVDVRGGMVGRIGDYDFNHAICFAGGSLPGLEAATGVSRALLRKQDHAVGFDVGLPLVSGAIIYDYGVRNNSIFPDIALGRAAWEAAQSDIFPLGACGAGRSATCGKGLLAPWQGESAGQGGAIGSFGSIQIGVFTVVNAVGAIVGRDGRVVRGHLNPETGERSDIASVIPHRDNPRFDAPGGTPGQNTTLTLVVTNAKIHRQSLQQLARQVHGSMSRAISPFNTATDGDILFAVSTNEVSDSGVNDFVLAHLASELAWDAVLTCYD